MQWRRGLRPSFLSPASAFFGGRLRSMAQSRRLSTTVNPAEINKFSRLASSWWQRGGPMQPLHDMNPVRVSYILSRLGHEPMKSTFPLQGLRIADVGCGAGILSECLARLGAKVTAIDASAANIAIAKEHAKDDPLLEHNLTYHHLSAQELRDKFSHRYHVVTSLEVIEHVDSPKLFTQQLISLLEPGGSLFVSTINRTVKSYAFAIAAAEYVLRLVEPGTHDWNKFVTPVELASMVRNQGVFISNEAGIVPDLRTGQWKLSNADLDVNYIVHMSNYVNRRPEDDESDEMDYSS